MAGNFDVATASPLPGGPSADDFIPVKRPGDPGLYKAGLIDLLPSLVKELPTSLPATSGKLWNNGGSLSIS